MEIQYLGHAILISLMEPSVIHSALDMYQFFSTSPYSETVFIEAGIAESGELGPVWKTMPIMPHILRMYSCFFCEYGDNGVH